MTEKEQLYYLINGVLDGSYQVKTFCSEFTRVYDLEIDEEELKIPNMFFSEESILNKAKYVKQLLE